MISERAHRGSALGGARIVGVYGVFCAPRGFACLETEIANGLNACKQLHDFAVEGKQTL